MNKYCIMYIDLPFQIRSKGGKHHWFDLVLQSIRHLYMQCMRERQWKTAQSSPTLALSILILSQLSSSLTVAANIDSTQTTYQNFMKIDQTKFSLFFFICTLPPLFFQFTFFQSSFPLPPNVLINDFPSLTLTDCSNIWLSFTFIMITAKIRPTMLNYWPFTDYRNHTMVQEDYYLKRTLHCSLISCKVL